MVSQYIDELVQRGVDKRLSIAVTGLSGSGKTTFITSIINQLFYINTGTRLPLFNVAHEQRILGVKKIPQRSMSIPSFPYEQSIDSLYADPPCWPISTTGVSEISLTLRYKTHHFLGRHLSQYRHLHIDFMDYPGEWLLDLPLLEQDYFSWSESMMKYVQSIANQVNPEWLTALQGLDPYAPVDETRLAHIAQTYTDYLQQCKRKGFSFIQPGRFVLPGELAGAPILQFFPWPMEDDGYALSKAKKNSTIAVLQARYYDYCRTIVSRFYHDYFSRFDRQIVLIDLLSALNNGAESFQNLTFSLTSLMQSFHYGKRTLWRRLFSPCIDKLLFAATKIDHITPEQYPRAMKLLDTIITTSRQKAAFEGIVIDSLGIASVKATQFGQVNHHGKLIPVLKGDKLSDGSEIMVFPGEVPTVLPTIEFWQKQPFKFEQFRPQPSDKQSALPHIRLDNVLEFLLGDKLQ